MPGFCTNSNRWLDFLLTENPKSCPYSKSGENCSTGGQCGYYQERKATRYYTHKKNILKSYGAMLGE